jgi:hypothetical protein
VAGYVNEGISAGLPYIRLIPKVTAVAGETLRLKCPVAGYPIEEIKWERANRELPDDLRQKVLPDGTLIISSVQKEGDAGVYTCWARNKQGHSARRSGDVAVIGKASLSFFSHERLSRRWSAQLRKIDRPASSIRQGDEDGEDGDADRKDDRSVRRRGKGGNGNGNALPRVGR